MNIFIGDHIKQILAILFRPFGFLPLLCLSIEDDNRFIFLTEIKNVGKPEPDIDV
jgi:hypothetical protein